MTLTGQVFTLMSGIATDAQAAEIVRAADRYLYDPRVGGYRLNTDFGGMQLNLGRCFGFAFGHKENGAMFSHMAVMYANALYRRGKVREGWLVLEGIYRHCQDFAASRMYPGLPEYISERGRGMYPWLTGSASWYLLTLLTEVFGVKGDLGDLVLEPKLVAAQFDSQGDATIRTRSPSATWRSSTTTRAASTTALTRSKTLPAAICRQRATNTPSGSPATTSPIWPRGSAIA